MALYEYRCSDCTYTFERIQKRGARAPRCPECGGRTERQISAPAIHFRGSGWYVTDYARKGRDKGKGQEGGKPASDAGKSGDKPAAKTAKDSGKKKD